jgi:uncharacterized membrane protein YecN with MAPEG domain
MSITILYAGLLAIWFLVLSIRVVQARLGPGKPSLGDGGDPMVLRRIRGHANFAEYVPMVLVLMALLEMRGSPAWVLHCIGVMLLVGRLLHGIALSYTRKFLFGRTAGVALTFAALLIGGGLCIAKGLQGL